MEEIHVQSAIFLVGLSFFIFVTLQFLLNEKNFLSVNDFLCKGFQVIYIGTYGWNLESFYRVLSCLVIYFSSRQRNVEESKTRTKLNCIRTHVYYL